MSKKITALIAGGAIALSATLALAGAPAAAPAAAAAPEKWQLKCNKPEGATQEVCELVYAFTAQAPADPKTGVMPAAQTVLIVHVLKPANTDTAVMIIQANLGAFLQPPPLLKVPGHPDLAAQFLD